MATSVFEKKMIERIEEKITGVTPGLQLQVYQSGRKICDIAVGETFPYYDLASLTKIIFTATAMILAFEEKKWNLQTKVCEHLKWYPHKDTKIVDLLNHSSGLVWWTPFYKKIQVQDSSLHKWSEAARVIRELPLEKTDTSVYSDVGFILLGMILESLYDKPLVEVWKMIRGEFFQRSDFNFHPDNAPVHAARMYAPTERCDWRAKLLQGEVHDDNTWAFGGVSSHAGLFGSVDDVSWYGLFLRSQIKGVSKTRIKTKTMKLFTERSRPAGKGDWALGFMMPTPGNSSSGNYFSSQSIGHTGFTGTSIWYDPVQDILVSLLSNRTLLGRENKEFAQLRPLIHNWVMESIKRN